MSEECELSRAKAAVYRLLKYRLRSEKEIIEKLRKKHFSESIIKSTVQYFHSNEILDDRQFAKRWIRSRLHKPYGLTRIKYELKQKGIESSVIDEEYSSAAVDYDEFTALLDLAQRRMGKYRNLAPEKAKTRLYGYLARRGFKSSTVLKVLKEVCIFSYDRK